MVQLRDISIFNIKSGIDRVLDVNTGQYGELQVHEGRPECLEVYAIWDGQNEACILNIYNSNLYYIKGET